MTASKSTISILELHLGRTRHPMLMTLRGGFLQQERQVSPTICLRVVCDALYGHDVVWDQGRLQALAEQQPDMGQLPHISRPPPPPPPSQDLQAVSAAAPRCVVKALMLGFPAAMLAPQLRRTLRSLPGKHSHPSPSAARARTPPFLPFPTRAGSRGERGGQLVSSAACTRVRCAARHKLRRRAQLRGGGGVLGGRATVLAVGAGLCSIPELLGLQLLPIRHGLSSSACSSSSSCHLWLSLWSSSLSLSLSHIEAQIGC
eukprot:3852966-Rhodomonas_salina.2